MDMASYIIHFMYTFASIFIIVSPFQASMIFISLTADASSSERKAICRRTIIVAFSTALLFALTGDLILQFFGITLDSVRVAGGILLFIMAVNMLTARKRHGKITEAEIDDAIEREEIAVFPLAMPLLTGPGVITTMIVLMGTASTLIQKAIVLAALFTTFLATYIMLVSSSHIERILGITGVLVLTRIMGLILGAIAVDFVSTGIWNIYIEMSG